MYSGRPIAPCPFPQQSFADIVIQRAVLMAYHTKPEYLKRNLDSFKQKIIDGLRNKTLKINKNHFEQVHYGVSDTNYWKNANSDAVQEQFSLDMVRIDPIN